MPETEADIVWELKPGHWAWFAGPSGEGFREVTTVESWIADWGTFEYDLAHEWVTVTHADGHVEHRPRYGTHEVWLSGDRPVFQKAT
jgi:hypothetical protein